MDTPDFLKGTDKESLGDDALAILDSLIAQYKAREQEIKQLEADLSQEKEAFRAISQERIPSLLIEYGLSEIRVRSGEKVNVKEDASVSVPDDKKARFHEFLARRGEEDIIKLQFQFKRMPDEKQQALFDFLIGNEYEFECERGVHPMTLKTYFKRLLGIGEPDREEGVAEGRYLRVSDVDAVANVFTYFTTKIK